ncbi:uncharacterized protein [Spinacia oleracea]|uniref:Uncharacterized protein n=1 Tax=Spinacia oleracea TaxID=3562 RepID=A0ABM3QYH9_SPIOL|nr:uncharacterized protein LOC130463356 [Spinacia oleracea]
MDVRDEIDMNKLQNPTKSKKTGKYKIENEIETEKQIDTVHYTFIKSSEQPKRLVLKIKRRPTKSQPEVQKLLSEGDGKASSTSETEVQKPLRGNILVKQLLAKSIKQNNKKKVAERVAAAAAKATKEAEERIATTAVANQIQAEKRASAAEVETKRADEEKASAADAEARRQAEEKASAADAEARRETKEKASAADAEARRETKEKASAAAAEARREAEQKEAENKRMEKNKELVEEATRKEAERNKKENDDATKAITKVVENVNASESEGQTNSGNGTKRGRKTTASKKKTLQNITIDEALQKKLHNISDSYKPKRNTRSMVTVQENVYAEIVSKEEFEGKDVSEVTSKVTNTPRKRKGAEKEDEDEPVDVEMIKTKKQKGVEKKTSVK